MAWAEREAVKQRYLVDATRARLSRGRIIKALERVHPLSVRACEVRLSRVGTAAQPLPFDCRSALCDCRLQDVGNQHFHLKNAAQLCSLVTNIDALCQLVSAGRISLVHRSEPGTPAAAVMLCTVWCDATHAAGFGAQVVGVAAKQRGAAKAV